VLDLKLVKPREFPRDMHIFKKVPISNCVQPI
jgi:hypothetical protein